MHTYMHANIHIENSHANGACMQVAEDKLMLNDDITGYPTTCGGRGDVTQRVCPCTYRLEHFLIAFLLM